MKTIRNVSPLGALVLPALGREVEAGEEFQCPDDIAAGLLDQPTNFEEVQPKGGK